MTFKELGYKGDDILFIEEDARHIYWPHGTLIKLRDVRGSIRGPDMSNGNRIRCRLATNAEIDGASRILT